MLNYRLGFLNLGKKIIDVKIKLIHVLYIFGGMKP
jgi:hypothetical protein